MGIIPLHRTDPTAGFDSNVGSSPPGFVFVQTCWECRPDLDLSGPLCERHRARQSAIIAVLSERLAFIPKVWRLDYRRNNNKRLLHVQGPSWAR